MLQGIVTKKGKERLTKVQAAHRAVWLPNHMANTLIHQGLKTLKTKS